MTVESSARTYRFPPLDRTGWLLGLSGAQCVILAAGVVTSGALLQAAAPAPAVLTPLVFSIALAFAGWDGRPAYEQIPPLVRMAVLQLTGKARWAAELPLLSGTVEDAERQPVLPPFLAGLTILDAGPAAWCRSTSAAGVAIVHDARQRTVSASLRVRGQGFALLERPEQDRLVAQWGGVLAAFCTERSPVLSVRLSEWAGPAGLGEFERFAEAHHRKAGSGAIQSYCELLADAAPVTTRHETLVTVTVPARRPRRGQRAKHAAADPAADVLLDQLRLLADRLEAADVAVEGPLSPVQTAEALRFRCDPALGGAAARGRAGSLAAMAGLVSRYNCGPLATETAWGHLRVDAALHRNYWVAEWPRLEVPAGWLEPLLLHPGGVRTFALHCEPVPPSRSRRGVDRDATRLAADGEQRSRAGFRVGARHRRSEVAVLEREAELVAGHAELGYSGFLTVTAATEEELDRSCADYEQAAALAGLELRALHGRHDLAFTCGLPIGRGLTARRCA
jgi:hypothetical protein